MEDPSYPPRIEAMTSARADFVLQYIRRLAGTRHTALSPDGPLLERFTAQRDEAAFATLVRRHGPMVLNVCRSVLRHEQDAEDAYQATFLVLARKAGSIRHPEAVAGWLYEVAYRVAVQAQADAARRRDLERRAPPLADADPTLDMTLRDLRRVLHEELRRLPDKYRLPLVLCYLEGRSHEEAANQLGWSKGTLRGRLDRGREHLRRRLAARGVALSALLSATAVAPRVTAEVLVDSVVRGAASGVLSARAAALAEGVTRAMFLTKAKLATAVLLAVGLIASGAGALAHQALVTRERPAGSPKSEVSNPKPTAAKPPTANDKDAIAYAGRVLGPDGRPVPGAKLHMTVAWGYPHRPSPSPVYATTGPDGRFRFTVPKAKFGDQFTVVAAVAANHGIGWVEIPANGKRDDLTVRLVEDDVPITGQVVDLEGKPVPGATLRLLEIRAAPGEDLGPWLDAAKSKKGLSLQLEQEYLKRYTDAVSLKATADARGRLRLSGIGRNRLVRAQLDGPTIASQQLCILTRPGEPIAVTEDEGNPEYNEPRRVTTYYGASFRLVAAPTKPVIGVVRDKDTKKPLAGITIQSHMRAVGPGRFRVVDIVRTTTDAEGRYRLTGMPKGEGFGIVAIPGRDHPYVGTNKGVPDSPGLDPVTVDFELRRGVWIEGKITDKVTGKPLRGAVEYFSLYSNPNLADYPGFDGTFSMDNIGVGTKEDGSYRVVGLPGPGLVAVRYGNHYLRAPERDEEYGVKESFLSTAPYHILPINYNALAKIDPAKGVDSAKRDVTLDPGWTFTGTVLGPDGKPLAGARSVGVTDAWGREGMKTAEFTVREFSPRRPRDILFQHPEKGLVGVVRPPKENGGPVTVRMEPGAVVTGRLVDADGRPRAGVKLEALFRLKGDLRPWPWHRYPLGPIKTDREGRFRFEALLAGYEFGLFDGKDELYFASTLRSGQTKDLGDVRLRRSEE
jgi:RNA polymerase sigma factor (sigma-70 family)